MNYFYILFGSKQKMLKGNYKKTPVILSLFYYKVLVMKQFFD